MSKEKKTTTKKKASTKSTAKKHKAEAKKSKESTVDKEEGTVVEEEELETPETPEKLETTAITEEPQPATGAAAEEEAATEEAPAEEEEEIEIVEEKFYDLNLRRIWNTPREKRTPRAIRFLRDFVAHRMKTDEVSISEETNEMLWQRGISKPPRRIRVRVVKDKEGKVIVFPGEGK